MIDTHRGTTRVVVIAGGVAAKFPIGDRGLRCNLFEAGIWKRNKGHPTRGQLLCPVLWCHPEGRVLVMPTATLLSPSVNPYHDLDTDSLWDYRPGDDEWPGEPKPEDWGVLDGRLVLIDYAASAP